MKIERMGEGKSAHEVIHLPNRLKEKVGEGEIDPRRLQEAEAALETLGVNYLDWALKDLGILQERLDNLVSGATPQAEALKLVFDVAHDMRAQGGSFGYPLVTRIGRSLCRFIDSLKTAERADINVISAHVDALSAVLRNRIEGDSNEIGVELAQGLEVAVARRKGL